MARGVDVTGWWAVFPNTAELPRRFSSKEDALEWWPEVKNGLYCPAKLVFEVWWQWKDPVLAPDQKNDVCRSNHIELSNPLSPEAFREELAAIREAEAEKARAKKEAAKNTKRSKKKEGLN